jgi:uncharacterized Zn-binding protein involved in type VI secretion
MGKPAARLGDIGSNHGAWHPSPITSGSGDVFINGKPAARVGDSLAPHTKPKSPPHGRSIAAGASQVFINGKPAARVGDAISCGGNVAAGSGNVFIGDSPVLNSPSDASLPNIEFPTQRGVIPALTHADGHVTPAVRSKKLVTYYPPPLVPYVEPPPEPSFVEADAYYSNSWKTPWPVENVIVRVEDADVNEVKIDITKKGA